ncbi:uncharacterized protein EV422DRAFT_155552 [Fimicolochytrium jonesii]|uniref:uncharacterized protein n=1 Tax=Fimicolochytrium jonesii TaxID=1396493 RepID=UPI0022FE6741|nr:uncharacterized protein EV422DRAFT_155552 [Fimicolochytrium jonesii]KAI8826150.1 hypothetical protein EV422DRAFT_155552 [Fimicolochytrium jonesii]
MSSQDVRLARAATTRLTVATHAILAILYTFDYGWLFSDSLHSPTKVGHSHLKQHPRLSNEIEFPTLTLPESSETEEVIPRDVMVLLGWMHKSLAAIDEPVLKHGNENLAEYIHVVAWHYSTDSFREDLRNVLPRAVETFQRSGSVSDRKASHTRPQLTLADIDAFILMLLIQRQAWCRQRKHAGSSGVEYLSAIGAWKPTELQQRFWLTALGKLGDPDDQCPADNILDEESFAQAIRDIRGVSASGQLLTASDGTGVHRRAVYGSIGLLYTRLSNRQPVRFKEAHHFLSVWESLVDDAEDGADLGETVVFDPEVQMASIDEADIKNAIQELTARNEGLAKKQSSLNLSLNSVSPRPVKVDSPLPSEDPTPSPENEASQQDVPGSDNAYAAVFSPVNSLPRTPNGRYVNRDSQGRLDVDRFAAPDGSESSHRPQASVKEELGKDVGRVSQLTPSRKPQAVQTPASARTRRHFQELEAMRKPPTEALQDSVSNGSSSPASVYGTPMRDTPIRASTAQFTGRYQPETPISHYYTPSAGEGSSIPVIRRPPFSSPAPSLIRLSVAQVEPAQESVTMGESFIQAPAPPSSPFWSKSPAGKSPAAPKTVAFDRETEPRETGQAHDEKNDDDEDLAEKEEKTVGLEKADRKMLPRFQLSGISHTPKRNPRELIGNRGDMSELRRRAHVKNAQLRFEGGQPDSNSSMVGPPML